MLHFDFDRSVSSAFSIMLRLALLIAIITFPMGSAVAQQLAAAVRLEFIGSTIPATIRIFRQERMLREASITHWDSIGCIALLRVKSKDRRAWNQPVIVDWTRITSLDNDSSQSTINIYGRFPTINDIDPDVLQISFNKINTEGVRQESDFFFGEMNYFSKNCRDRVSEPNWSQF